MREEFNCAGCKHVVPASVVADWSGKVWREWFDRMGDAATVEVVNATATLVIAEREIYVREAVEAATQQERERIKEAIKRERLNNDDCAYNVGYDAAVDNILDAVEKGGEQ